jgi:hypothetical protein
MKCGRFVFSLACALDMPVSGGAEALTPPEIVQVEVVRADADSKFVVVGNEKGSYRLSCNLKAGGCLTPVPGRAYYVFDKSTRWKMPGATEIIGLAFVQDWTVSYKQGENIGLVPKDSGGPGELGMYMLETWIAKKH